MATPTSSSSAAAGNGTAKTSGRKKKVASQAGVARYGKPIGSEIGGPRDANHAAIQNDQGARKNYGDLINGDAEAQRKALDGMSTEDLNKLADIAFSFKSSDPKVVALRIAARNAQARKGIRVPVGQTQTKGAAPAKPGNKPVARKPTPKKKAAPAKKAAPPPAAPRNMGRVRAMAGADPASQRLIELSNAKAEADKRAGRGTTSSGSFPVNSPKQVRDAQRAIGRAKPEHRPAIARHIIAQAKKLNCSHMISDATAHYARGERKPGSINMARTPTAVELAGRWKHGYIPLDATAMASKMKGGKGKPWWGGPGHSSGGSAKKALHGSPKSGSPGGSSKLTNVVKSGSADSKPRGAKVTNPPNAAFSRATMIKRAKENGLSQAEAEKWADDPNRKMLLGNKAVGPSRTPKPGDKQDTTGKSKLTFEPIDPVTRRPVDKPKTPSTPAIKDPKRGTSDKAMTSPSTLAKAYVQMHGDAGARQKIAQMEARKTLTAKDRAQLAALKAAVSGKA